MVDKKIIITEMWFCDNRAERIEIWNKQRLFIIIYLVQRDNKSQSHKL